MVKSKDLSTTMFQKQKMQWIKVGKNMMLCPLHCDENEKCVGEKGTEDPLH